jgi:hypothetical protein
MAARNALIVLFLAVITLPLAATLAGVEGGDAVAENRTLAGFPELQATWSSVADFPAGFTSWFEDHFAFRYGLVRLASRLRYFVLGVSPAPTVVKGREGWLFYADDAGVDDYLRASPFAPEALDDWRESLVRSERWLRAQGMGFVFTIAPDKHVLYPDELPGTLQPLDNASRMDQLFAALAGSGVAAVDARPLLESARTRERLYEKTDTHWNERGAFVAYRQLVAAIREQVPEVPPAWPREAFLDEDRLENGMDLAALIGLRDVLREDRLLLRPRRPRRARTLEPAGGEPWWQVGRVVTEIPGSPLPRAVVFRDSFMARLAPFLSEHFSRVVYLWQNNFDVEAVRAERPAIVIQEIVGRHLLNVSPYSDAPPRAE